MNELLNHTQYQDYLQSSAKMFNNYSPEDTQMPEHLSDVGKLAYKTIMEVMGDNIIDTGGCTTFYSPVRWRERKEDYGTRSELIIVYDGGTVGDFFSYDNHNYDLINKMSEALEAVGLYTEQCTHWYSALYKI
jgi:hypothetical protein